MGLGDAGILDLLLVNSDGLPIAVEVKLACNGEARRQIVAQAVDYLSALTALTVDELDDKVSGKLESALRKLVPDSDEEFERIWQAVGTKLRAGEARLVLVLDDAPPGLERMCRFLARNSQLDIQLLTVTRYVSAKLGEIFVPRSLVNLESDVKPRRPQPPAEPSPELISAVHAYNTSAPSDLQAFGAATTYRQIQPSKWKGPIHYEFYRTRDAIRAELHLESESLLPVATVVEQFSGRPVAGGNATLLWQAGWRRAGRLSAQFPLDTAPTVVALAMRDLIEMTRNTVTDALTRPDVSVATA